MARIMRQDTCAVNAFEVDQAASAAGLAKIDNAHGTGNTSNVPSST